MKIIAILWKWRTWQFVRRKKKSSFSPLCQCLISVLFACNRPTYHHRSVHRNIQTWFYSLNVNNVFRVIKKYRGGYDSRKIIIYVTDVHHNWICVQGVHFMKRKHQLSVFCVWCSFACRIHTSLFYSLQNRRSLNEVLNENQNFTILLIHLSKFIQKTHWNSVTDVELNFYDNK